MSVGQSYQTTRNSKPGQRRHVLFLIDHLGFGGSEGQLRLLLKYLNPERWEASVLVYHPSPNDDHISDLREGGHEIIVMTPGFGGPIRKTLITARLVRRIRPHVIHSWTIHDNPYASVGGLLFGAKVRWGSLRGSTSLSNFRSLPRWYRRLCLRSVQRLVVNSGALVGELSRLGLGVERVMLLPNCVEEASEGVDRFESSGLGDLGFTPVHRVFGNIGNVRRVKNQLLFVRALGKVIDRHPEVRGVIVGSELAGEEDTIAEIRREIQQRGLEKQIVLAGFCADVPRVVRGLTALCMVSDSEGMPNVILEAMAARVPVVATAIGGVPEIVKDGETGVLVPHQDEEALIAAVERVLGAPDEMRRMAEMALNVVVANRKCAAMASRLEAAYDAALEQAGAV